ncbi:MAG: ankyrin repeat protein [Syntrophaceae bacterium]|nr:MAG: ankyrin repeat protein [Syntrophaceae bacterium]
MQQIFRFVSKVITSALERCRKEGKSEAGDIRLALIEAVRSGNRTEVARLLVRPGADVTVRDKDGRTILHSLVPELVKLADSEKVPLYDCIVLLLAGGADISAGDNDGNTPLNDAVKLGDVKTVEFLLKNGADVNARDNDGKTPLHIINTVLGDRSTPGQIEKITEMLIQSGADVNARDNKQQTPLFFSRIDSMVVLIAGGADVNARDKEGKTPIFCIKSQKCLETLIEKGADIEAIDTEGKKYCQ